MADLSALFSDIDIDQEDISYLQQSFQAIIPESQPYDLQSVVSDAKESVSKPVTLTHNYCSLENCDLTNKRNNNNQIEKSTEKTTFPSTLSSEQHSDQTKLFEDIVNKGIDEEDIKYLKLSFINLKRESNDNQWMSKLSWIEHPFTTTDCEDPGCARTREFCKVQKLSSPRVRGASQVIKSSVISSSPYGKNYKIIKNTVSRNARNEQRRLFTAYESITESSLLTLNELKFRKKKLRLGKSEIHRLGLFAAEDIPANDIIIEYVGEIIRPIIADIREQKYRLSGIGSYCFKLDEETIIDATRYGNLNRFINHSCVPNSIARILNINNKKKIVIYSKQAITVDEEITYDYKMPIEKEKILCQCKAIGCRRTLN